MPAHRKYTAEEFRLVKLERNREWRRRNRGWVSGTTKLMRWYSGMRNITKLRIVLDAIGFSADDMLRHLTMLRKNSRKTS